MPQLRADLPTRRRVVYRTNPLVEVICAVRFPAILQIAQDLPTDFQRSIYKDYPFAELLEPVAAIAVRRDDKTEQAAAEPKFARNLRFKSEDGKWALSLEPDLLALTCTAYRRWEEFLPAFEVPLRAFAEIYKVPFYTRIGLRFRSVLNREAMGLSGRPWRELVQEPVLSALEYFAGPVGELGPLDFVTVLDIDPGKLRLQLSTVTNERKEIGLLIDTDCFNDSEKFRSIDAIIERVVLLHEYSGRIFQACITDAIHNKLDPEAVQP